MSPLQTIKDGVVLDVEHYKIFTQQQYTHYSRGHENGYVTFNQHDSSRMVFSLLYEECKPLFNATER